MGVLEDEPNLPKSSTFDVVPGAKPFGALIGASGDLGLIVLALSISFLTLIPLVLDVVLVVLMVLSTPVVEAVVVAEAEAVVVLVVDVEVGVVREVGSSK